MTRPWLLALALASSACASRNYTYYLLEPAPEVNAVLEEPEGTQLRPFAFGSTTSSSTTGEMRSKSTLLAYRVGSSFSNVPSSE